MDEQNTQKVAPEQLTAPKKPARNDFLAIAIPLAIYALGHIGLMVAIGQSTIMYPRNWTAR